ncbi:MAG: M20/M25/M40 family metallo-hydrolase [Planctomycetales bacterium]|nr:M20/M25/M40 family metallo-hydrolase [Planctomycetales bacterium]
MTRSTKKPAAKAASRRSANPSRVKSSKSSAKSSASVELLLELLALSGPSGGEGPVADFIIKRLRGAGLPAEAVLRDSPPKDSPVAGAAGNLIVKLPGTRRGRRRMLSAHMDTVPICQGARPVKRGRKIVAADRATGLGGDDRAGCAVILATALELLSGGHEYPPLTFLWTVQEEVGLHGARTAKLGLLGRPRMGFNWDGRGASQLTIGATGGYRMGITVNGIASHAGGHPEDGVSAIAVASLAIADLVHNGWHGLIEKGGRRGTSNVGIIAGGAATNVVTDRVALRAEARSHDADFRVRIVREMERAFEQASRQVKTAAGKTGSVEFDGRLDYEAFRLDRDEPAVQLAAAAVVGEGLAVDYNVANGGLDANWLTMRGVPTVTLGCGQNSIHTAAEWLDLDEFERAVAIAGRVATME